ncbi:MAG: hypothetical protein QOH61_654 [Chloroflexota bacterium]|nr:hypothetical protein [Chloroflexota bacterium]
MSTVIGQAATASDPIAAFDAAERAMLGALADHLIPAAHGMPSARDVIDDRRLRFVLTARPDLLEPLRAAVRAELPAEPAARLAALQRDEPDLAAALVLAVVGAYYTDGTVRERLGYPGQQAITLQSWRVPQYIDEGLVDQVLARGPIWRDPSTGRTAIEDRPMSMTFSDPQA